MSLVRLYACVLVFSLICSIGMLIGGMVTKKSIVSLGQHGHTTATHYTGVAADLLLGLFPSSVTQWVAGFMGWLVYLGFAATISKLYVCAL
jgi:hypothetical protein